MRRDYEYPRFAAVRTDRRLHASCSSEAPQWSQGRRDVSGECFGEASVVELLVAVHSAVCQLPDVHPLADPALPVSRTLKLTSPVATTTSPWATSAVTGWLATCTEVPSVWKKRATLSLPEYSPAHGTTESRWLTKRTSSASWSRM